ncbi:hypothetical protein BV22DRAFT_1126055 [Leucogyrophana mollusca]|uniref:Uncharacterized protein n=1 Tax=Leucogyrophana mollusca TaxID=85980 RepID=A0ACB8BSP5_9AGAM|nr:hypothetical protein BV22DRAFT_1126055 [Leucogyrophana mollusca]
MQDDGWGDVLSILASFHSSALQRVLLEADEEAEYVDGTAKCVEVTAEPDIWELAVVIESESWVHAEARKSCGCSADPHPDPYPNPDTPQHLTTRHYSPLPGPQLPFPPKLGTDTDPASDSPSDGGSYCVGEREQELRITAARD